MPATPHIEKHFTSSETVRDVVIGMSDGLTVPFALAAGLSRAVEHQYRHHSFQTPVSQLRSTSTASATAPTPTQNKKEKAKRLNLHAGADTSIFQPRLKPPVQDQVAPIPNHDRSTRQLAHRTRPPPLLAPPCFSSPVPSTRNHQHQHVPRRPAGRTRITFATRAATTPIRWRRHRRPPQSRHRLATLQFINHRSAQQGDQEVARRLHGRGAIKMFAIADRIEAVMADAKGMFANLDWFRSPSATTCWACRPPCSPRSSSSLAPPAGARG